MSIISSIMLMTTMALADGPKFSVLGENEPAPFEGVLFDPEATASLMSDKDFWRSQCDIEIEYQLDLQATEFALEFKNAQIRYAALSDEADMIIAKKDEEIVALHEALKKNSPNNRWFWYAGGVVTGVAATYGAYRAFASIALQDMRGFPG